MCPWTGTLALCERCACRRLVVPGGTYTLPPGAQLGDWSPECSSLLVV